MKNNRSLLPIFTIMTLSFLVVLSLGSCSRKGATEKDIQFFYLETCPSCEDYKMAESLSEMVLSLKGRAYNIANPENGKVLKNALQEKKFPDISHSLPLLLTGENYYNGYEEIRIELERLSQ